MIIDHVGIGVSDFVRSREFYTRALAPLGIELISEVTAEMTGNRSHTGFGAGGRPQFWISSDASGQDQQHIAFATRSREVVGAFHEAALEAGGTDNGAPGFREMYHPNYYGAFVLDPDGHNVEAVCHEPE
jgi:catechol 2,3-dioxygenase-like lactoylglutathione lyase family enzyme